MVFVWPVVVASVRRLLRGRTRTILGVPVASTCRGTIRLVIRRVRHGGKGLIAANVNGTKRVTVGVTAAFYSANVPTIFLRPDRTRRKSLKVLRRGSLLLLVSGSKGAHRVIRLARLTRGLGPGLGCVIVAKGTSDPLTQRSSVYLYAKRPSRIYTLNVAPAASAAIVAIVNSVLMIRAVGGANFAVRRCDGHRRKKCLNRHSHRLDGWGGVRPRHGKRGWCGWGFVGKFISFIFQFCMCGLWVWG